MMLTFHVDDILLSYNEAATAQATAFKAAILARFDGRDEGRLTSYLGVDISYDREQGTISMSQASLIHSLLDRTGLANCNPTGTPLPPGIKLTKPTKSTQLDPVLGAKYREIVGTLQYLATWTRIDIAHAAHVLAKYASCATTVH
mmetsp:Transcript_35978/g.90630  ORF Transcript_35978/g.90630 Transcript_35978/m.90630 type:complete len:145 (-) Transcript_35978:34-468(-)